MSYKKLFRKVVETVKRLFWVLAPAGGFINPFKVIATYFTHSRGELQDLICKFYPNQEIFFLNSGKAALFQLFYGLRVTTGKKIIGIPAYTCPDIACSAIRAGLELNLLDLEKSNSLSVSSPKNEDINNLCAVLASNLYGVDDAKNIRAFCENSGLVFIDDICQASFIEGNNNVIRVSSFGRGKAFSGVGGGLLSIPSESKFESLISEINYSLREVPHAHFSEDILYWLKLFIFWILERPYVYWIIAYLPFTGLGETRIKLSFHLRKASKMELATMLTGLRAREKEVEGRLRVSNLYAGKEPNKEILTRYPMILEPSARMQLATENNFVRKYGLSFSYPKCLDEYDELQSYIVNSGFENSRKVSRGIVTLPTHRYVRTSDAKFIIEKINALREKENA